MRPSLILTTREDGILDFWDILYEQKNPILSRRLGNWPLRCIEMTDDGLMVAAGSDGGAVSALRLSEDLAQCSKVERANIGNMFEREAKREKILEGRNKEIRFLEKKKAAKEEREKKERKERWKKGRAKEENIITKTPEDIERERLLVKSDEDFFEIIKKIKTERRKAGQVGAWGTASAGASYANAKALDKCSIASMGREVVVDQ